jgi:hypothetical protein
MRIRMMDRLRLRRTALLWISVSALMTGMIACNDSQTPFPPSGGSGPQACDGSAGAELVEVTVIGSCTRQTSASTCPAGSDPPNSITACSFSVNNRRAAAVIVNGNANPPNAVIVPVINSMVADQSAVDINVVALCSTANVAKGNLDVVVTDQPTGNVLCQSAVPFDVTIVP